MEKLTFKINRFMKSVSLFCIASFFYCTASSQTLFTYGSNAVDKEEFLKAYNKNKTATSNKEEALREYLDLYSKFKLKVKAARDLRLDSLPQLKSDLENFRSQIEENYLNNDNFMNQLISEAADHAVTDLHVLHIFVPAKEGIAVADSVKAANTAQELYSKLAAGEKDIDKLVQDITAKLAPARVADLGYVTAFALPYEYEKIIYATKTGGISKPYHSKKRLAYF
jgi:peptidyl-prolyl cis-trans isomerase SurA